MGKRKAAKKIANKGLIVKNEISKNKKIKFDEIDETNASNSDVHISQLNTSHKQVKTKEKSKTDMKKNKRIIMNDDNDEPAVAENQVDEKLSQENEEDIKDEDIDKFCDELNEEDNEQYETWVKLIEAKLHSNKNK